MTYRYQSCRNDDALRERLVEPAREKLRFGYRPLRVLLRREAFEVNHKKVQRVYREPGLTGKRRRRTALHGQSRTASTSLDNRPGKPTENSYVESFHGRLRDECLNVSWFWNLFDARRKISAWRLDYNSRRPHSSLGYRTPEEFIQQWLLARRDHTLHKEGIERRIRL